MLPSAPASAVPVLPPTLIPGDRGRLRPGRVDAQHHHLVHRLRRLRARPPARACRPRDSASSSRRPAPAPRWRRTAPAPPRRSRSPPPPAPSGAASPQARPGRTPSAPAATGTTRRRPSAGLARPADRTAPTCRSRSARRTLRAAAPTARAGSARGTAASGRPPAPAAPCQAPGRSARTSGCTTRRTPRGSRRSPGARGSRQSTWRLSILIGSTQRNFARGSTRFRSSAAAAVITLNVEPGVYVDWIARLTSGKAGSLTIASQRSSIWPGSNVGALAIARIAPVFGIEHDDRPRLAAQRVDRRLLDPRVQRQHDVRADRRAVEQRRRSSGRPGRPSAPRAGSRRTDLRCRCCRTAPSGSRRCAPGRRSDRSARWRRPASGRSRPAPCPCDRGSCRARRAGPPRRSSGSSAAPAARPGGRTASSRAPAPPPRIRPAAQAPAAPGYAASNRASGLRPRPPAAGRAARKFASTELPP